MYKDRTSKEKIPGLELLKKKSNDAQEQAKQALTRDGAGAGDGREGLDRQIKGLGFFPLANWFPFYKQVVVQESSLKHLPRL